MKFFDQLNSNEKHRKSLKDGTAMNTNKDNSTARPWQIEIDKLNTHFIKSVDGEIIAVVNEGVNETLQNAKLIVKAVNMHDDLVSAVNDAFCLIGEALIDNCPTEEEREEWSSLQDRLRELLLRSDK